MVTQEATLPVAVLGAGGTGLLMAETVERLAGFRFVGFLDDDSRKTARDCCGYAVLGTLADWAALPSETVFLSSLYGPKVSSSFFSLVHSLAIPSDRWARVVDGTAHVSRHASLGAGSYVGPGCVVEPRVTLGMCCALLGNVYVAHDAQLGDYVCCANSASLAGRTVVGPSAFVGAAAAIRENISIGARTTVGLGAVVVKPVAEEMVVVGNPAVTL
jgi:sugar O-acyltransferase (sialic acid O-acetyltransferase NeuD family)